MAIGDLLAQISGGQPSPTPAPSLQRSTTVPKRRAEDDLRQSASKTLRPNTPMAARPSQPISRPLPSRQPTNAQASKPTVPLRRANDVNRITKPAGPARPALVSANGAAVAKPAPKKGSFAEILARGQRAQTVMGQVGKIQHKKVEGSALKKKDDTLTTPKSQGRRPNRSSGSAKPNRKEASNANGASSNGRNGTGPRPSPGATKKTGAGKKAAQQEQEKKVKKAVQATTGYTGTARPKPGATAKKDKAPRGGALLNVAPPRPASSKRLGYEEDYDEELDDFIDYDDDEEEDQGGPRYDYASDASSDMEAGLDDIDVEERRAAAIARREDVEEEQLEKSLKAAKEDRKRRALEALRAGRRN